MKVNYTLPGMLPEASRAPAAEPGEPAPEPFGRYLERLRAPEFTDWRALLRLNTPTAGLAGMAPPAAPPGIGSRYGASQRAWWRGMLRKHANAPESDAEGRPQPETGNPAVERMLAWLSESQRREDEIFARYLAEGDD